MSPILLWTLALVGTALVVVETFRLVILLRENQIDRRVPGGRCSRHGSTRSSQREERSSKVYFSVDADVVEAESVDMSKTGIQLVTDTPLLFCLRIDEEHPTGVRAELVWARRKEGEMAYGFAFLLDEDGNTSARLPGRPKPSPEGQEDS